MCSELKARRRMAATAALLLLTAVVGAHAQQRAAGAGTGAEAGTVTETGTGTGTEAETGTGTVTEAGTGAETGTVTGTEAGTVTEAETGTVTEAETGAGTEARADAAGSSSLPETSRTRQARLAVARARALFGAGDFGAALTDFIHAYELLAGDPRRVDVLNNIAVCYERMFRYDLALRYYQRFLDEGASDPDDRAQVRALMTKLREFLGVVRLRSNTEGEVWVGDRQLGSVPGEILVPAGPHVIELRAPGYQSARREVQIAPGSSQTIRIELEPLPEYRGLSPAYFWTGVGLSAAALITGAVFGVQALSEHDARQERDADRGLVPDPQRVQDLQLAADLSLGAGLVLAVSTAVLFTLTDFGDADGERRVQDAQRPSVSLALAPGRRASALFAAFAGPLP